MGTGVFSRGVWNPVTCVYNIKIARRKWFTFKAKLIKFARNSNMFSVICFILGITYINVLLRIARSMAVNIASCILRNENVPGCYNVHVSS